METMALKKDLNETDARVYEVGYLLLPTIPEEDIPRIYSGLKDLLEGLQAEIISDEVPKLVSLAYTMNKSILNVRHKFSTAYFSWTKFAVDAEEILALKKKLDLEPNILRFLITKTVRENTLAAKRFAGRDRIRPRSRAEEGAPPAPINKEEIDKEIDAMVAA